MAKKKSKSKQTVEQLDKAKITKKIVISDREKQKQELLKLEAENRQLKVAGILAMVPFKTEEKRTIVLEGLVNSNVTIDFIRETYEPFIKQNNQNKSSSKETKLPQKSTYIS